MPDCCRPKLKLVRTILWQSKDFGGSLMTTVVLRCLKISVAVQRCLRQYKHYNCSLMTTVDAISQLYVSIDYTTSRPKTFCRKRAGYVVKIWMSRIV